MFTTLIAAIAIGVAAGLIIYYAIKLTVKAIIGLVKKLRAKGAKKTLVADVNSMIAECTNRKSMKELEKLQDDGVTHITAGVDKNGKLVDEVQLIENEDDDTAYEVVDLLGDEGMVVIED